jgi:hypothetical protein
MMQTPKFPTARRRRLWPLLVTLLCGGYAAYPGTVDHQLGLGRCGEDPICTTGDECTLHGAVKSVDSICHMFGPNCVPEATCFEGAPCSSGTGWYCREK